METIYNFLREISRSDDATIKSNFLLNFPALIKFVDAKIYSSFKTVYLEMATESDPKVRLYWINTLLDITEMIHEAERYEAIKPSLGKLMRMEDDFTNIKAVIERLVKIYNLFFKKKDLEEQDLSSLSSKKPRPALETPKTKKSKVRKSRNKLSQFPKLNSILKAHQLQ